MTRMFVTAFDSTSFSFPSSSFSLPIDWFAPSSPPKKTTAVRKKKRGVKYGTPSLPRTIARHEVMVATLESRLAAGGMTVSELGKALGMSRQLALYHLKKLVAAGRIAMVLEPCPENQKVRFRCWALSRVNYSTAA